VALVFARLASGQLKGSIQCKYHAWTYGLDGRLIGAPNILSDTQFERAQFGLLPVARRSGKGLIWLNLADDPPPARAQLDEPIQERFGTADTFAIINLAISKLAKVSRYCACQLEITSRKLHGMLSLLPAASRILRSATRLPRKVRSMPMARLQRWPMTSRLSQSLAKHRVHRCPACCRRAAALLCIVMLAQCSAQPARRSRGDAHTFSARAGSHTDYLRLAL